MNDETKRAWRDAQEDHEIEEARRWIVLWRLFWAMALMGGSGSLLWHFFHAEER